MTTGPWKPIKLETYQNRIADLDIRSEVSIALDVKLSATFAFSEKTPGYASFVLKKPDGSVEASADKIPVNGAGLAKVQFEWQAGEIQLWYPVGYGAQPLYIVEVVLTDKVRWNNRNHRLSMNLISFACRAELFLTRELTKSLSAVLSSSRTD